MSKVELSRPCALSIAGLDPSAGAGLLADVKTFEANCVLGLGVCSALTCQNDREFLSLEWVSASLIVAQLEPLVDRFPIGSVKIGLIENLEVLKAVVDFLNSRIPNVRIVWDPVAKASAGFIFHREFEAAALQEVAGKLTLITPNRDEAKFFEGLLGRSCECGVLEKSKHSAQGRVSDVLCIGGETFEFQSKLLDCAEKHGSGCVLSAAICAALAKGEALFSACAAGRNYSEAYLASSDNLIGYHTAYAQ